LRYGFPTRRKKQRETHVEIGTIDERGRPGRAKVPVTEYPVGAMFPHFGRSGFVLGTPPNLDVLRHTANVYSTDDLNEFAARYKWNKEATLAHFPVEFARTIGKISYAYAVAELGYGSFTPICIPHIMSKNHNVSYVFGQVGMNTPIKGEQPVWKIELLFATYHGKPMLYAFCSLLPEMGTPIYEVLLGYFESDAQISFFKEQLANKSIVIAPLSFT